MNISDEGLRLIKSFEGYMRALPDGSCAAYQDRYNGKLDKPTIGWGCTENVSMGLVWTRGEAEAALRKEVSRFETGVARLVTVEINQNEFDALVSFSYNVGLGALQRSSLLTKLNKGDRHGAAEAFKLWNRAGGSVSKGLVSRRAREAALFLKPVEQPSEPFMPQSVDAGLQMPSHGTVALASAGITAGTSLLSGGLPAPPDALVTSLTNVQNWQSVGGTLWTFKQSALEQPMLALLFGAALLALWLWPKRG